MKKSKVKKSLSERTQQNKNDLRVRKTRKALQDAILELAKEYDFDEITINQICDRAHIRRVTFYRHYKGKSDFVANVVQDLVDACTEFNSVHIHESPKIYYDYVINDVLNFMLENERLIRGIFYSKYAKVATEQIYTKFIDIVRREVLRNKMCTEEKLEEKKFVIYFVCGGIMHLVYGWLDGTITIPKEEYAKEINYLMLSIWKLELT